MSGSVSLPRDIWQIILSRYLYGELFDTSVSFDENIALLTCPDRFKRSFARSTAACLMRNLSLVNKLFRDILQTGSEIEKNRWGFKEFFFRNLTMYYDIDPYLFEINTLDCGGYNSGGVSFNHN